MAALEHQTRFTKLHEQRAAVITELYQRMDRIRQLWEASARSVRFNSEPSPDDQQIMASRLSHALVDFYFQNKLFFERELCQAMEELFRANWEVLASIGAASTLDQFVASGDVAAATSRRTFLVSANDVILNKLPPVMATVESKMRSMLGITEAPAAGR